MFGFLITLFFLLLVFPFMLVLFIRMLFNRLFYFRSRRYSQSKSQITQPLSQKKKKINSDKGEYIEYEEIKREQ